MINPLEASGSGSPRVSSDLSAQAAEAVWLGLPVEHLVGELPARELAALCRRRLWPEPRNLDPEVPDQISNRFYCFGRPNGYLRQRTAELLHLAELAGDGLISWG